jgi:hypothetical protein
MCVNIECKKCIETKRPILYFVHNILTAFRHSSTMQQNWSWYSLLIGILVISTEAIKFDDIYEQEQVQHHRRGLVQYFADNLLSRVEDQLAEIKGNSTLVELIFSYFKNIYHRTYSTQQEERQRFRIFKQRLINIIGINVDSSLTYTAEINDYTDWSDSEFDEAKKGLDVSISRRRMKRNRRQKMFDWHEHRLDHRRRAASSLDWVSRGYVTSVKNQQTCGDCYAFATMGVLEGAWARKTGKLVDFSPQQLADCSALQGLYIV